MLTTWIRRVTKSKEFFDGAKILPEHTRLLPFQNNTDNLTQMFELRSWFIKNSPHSTYN